MTTAIPNVWQSLIQEAHQESPWHWLWTITLRSTTSSTPIVRLVHHPSEVVVGGNTYHPFPIVHSAIEQNSDGDLPQMEVQLDNTGKLLAPYVDQGGGFLNRPVSLLLVNGSDLTQSYSFDFIVTACSLSTGAATLRLEIDNWFRRMIPLDVFNAFRCRHLHGGTRCGYIVNGAAAFQSCDQTIEACIAHGADMTSRNLAARQPQSFGGFLGIPQG